jgi:hypothetical protein
MGRESTTALSFANYADRHFSSMAIFPLFHSLLRSIRIWFRSQAMVQLEIISLRH